MKTKILFLACSLVLGLSTANAKFEAINQGDLTDKFLMYADFDNDKIISESPYQVLLKMKTGNLNQGFKDELQNHIPNIKNYSKVWITGEYIIDCDNSLITSQNRKLLGEIKKINSKISVINQYQLGNKVSITPIDLHDKTDNLIYKKVCKTK